ncbi:high affinity immunoglobulin gamma Fc receptor I [Pangasianodon hypophthalmus]|uniref:high affinity immunoglobulin gamma Fc receptor I n=1 Tax=Pangasianodon hypophthalmus TaxID=310915 RepID=UPI000EFE5910|nr:high affinity immunoglobulin gamma Fc receptor I [Pangasianodon hypophthalmus]
MHFFHNLFVFLALLASVRLDDEDPAPPPVKAKATLSLGELWFFSGEDVQMTCSVPDDPSTDWSYQWFLDGVLLSSTNVYSIQKARVQQSGNYTCQGQKLLKEWPYSMLTIPSNPLKINVDGGWVLLRMPFEPLIVEETMTLTCRVRDDPLLSKVIFYKGEVEVTKQKNKNLVFPSLKLEDNGMYSCRATWVKNQEYHSAQSVPSSVTVLDKLETPRLVLLGSRGLVRSGNQVVFRCITKVNAREQGLSVEYHYLKDGNRLGPASATDTYVIAQVSKDDAGVYTCKVRVRALNVVKWSNEVRLKVLPPVNL